MSQSEADLRVLIDGVRARDPDAWEALYRGSYAMMFGYAHRRLGTNERADDAVMEAMTRALARIDSFTWRGVGIQAWLFGILRNVILEMVRRPEPSALTGHDPPDTQPNALEGLVADEEHAAVRAAFARLSPEDQEVLELRMVHRIEADAVGRAIGKRAGAVRMAQARALSRLRVLLAEGASS